MTTFADEAFLNYLSSMTPEQMNIAAYGDDAVRLSNQVRACIASGYGGRGWIAFRLDNGGSNDHVYEDRSDAIRDSQRDLSLMGSRCSFVKIPMDDMPPKAARAYINVMRRLDDAGFRLTDPDQKQFPILGRRLP